MATAVFSRQVFSLLSTLPDEGLAIVVKEPVELVLFEVAVVCVEDVDGWTGACMELSVGGSLQILVWFLRLHL